MISGSYYFLGTFSASMFEDLERESRHSLKRSSTSPSSLLRRLQFPESGILEHLKAAEIFYQTISMLRCQLLNSTSAPNSTDIPDLSECELVLSALSGCEEHRQVADCSDFSTGPIAAQTAVVIIWITPHKGPLECPS